MIVHPGDEAVDALERKLKVQHAAVPEPEPLRGNRMKDRLQVAKDVLWWIGEEVVCPKVHDQLRDRLEVHGAGPFGVIDHQLRDLPASVHPFGQVGVNLVESKEFAAGAVDHGIRFAMPGREPHPDQVGAELRSIIGQAGPFGELIPNRPRCRPRRRPTLSRGDRRARWHFSLSRATMRGAAGDVKTPGLWDGSRPQLLPVWGQD